jgi:hypothetical protein
MSLLPDSGKDLLPKVSLQRPLLLRITCILSFIMSGVMLLAFGFGVLSFFVSEKTILSLWPNLQNMQPELRDVSAETYFNGVGQYCILAFILQLISLLAIIQMWKERVKGFYIYIASELVFYLIPYLIGFTILQGEIGSITPYLIVDFIFIGVYAYHFFILKKQVN